jgi:hypothetical protein
LKRDKMSAKAAGRAKVRRVQILFFQCRSVSLFLSRTGRFARRQKRAR